MKYYVDNEVTKIDTGDELLLSKDDSQVVSLKGTSKFIFELVEQGYDVDGIISKFLENYRIDFEVNILKQDILECIGNLINQGLLRSENDE